LTKFFSSTNNWFSLDDNILIHTSSKNSAAHLKNPKMIHCVPAIMKSVPAIMKNISMVGKTEDVSVI
jgi:hypothetical protein